MDKHYNVQLCDILLKWLQTFEVEAPTKSLHDICDGVAMAQALHQISPEWFSNSWLSKIKSDTGGNWRLKVSNLKKIVEGIVDYYQECFNQPLTDFGRPDVVQIGDKEDAVELGRLLQLILGCAVNCNHKQDYITVIMGMEESVQRVIMQSIQELESIHGAGPMSFSASLALEAEPQVQQLLIEIQSVTEARDQMAQRCLELDMQVSLLQEEKMSLHEEKKRLTERLHESKEEPITGSSQLRRQVESLKEELFKIETSRDDYRLKLEIQEKEIAELQSKLEKLQQTAGEARHLKDEVDILRETAEKVEKYEATIKTYKKKLEELGDLKREVKLLESKNLNYIQQNMDLEEELKKAGSWRTQVDIYKKQVAELHQKLNEGMKRNDKLEFESRKTQEKLNAVQKEKERLIIERDSLRETNEELKCCQFLQMNGTDTVEVDQPQNATVTAEDIVSTTELKQKLVRLQHENNMLRLNQRSPEDENVSVVQALLDDTVGQLNQMSLDCRQANQRIMELEGELKEVSERGEEGTAGLRLKVNELQNKLQREKEQHTSDIDERDTALTESKQIVIIMQDTINQKDLEFQELEEKHKKYIEKAKSVIKSLDPKEPVPLSAEVNTLQNQLIEKQKVIDEMEKEFERNKIMKEIEEKLLTSAFHNLGQMRQRESVDQRLANLSLGQGQSFLSRQRQPTSRKIPLNFNSK